jgi:cytochrome c oxidase accessory protein FixG
VVEKIPLVEVTPSALVNQADGRKMAQVNGKFYVRLVAGVYQNLRRLVSWPLIALFFLTVWLQWDGHPLVLFSMAERRIFLWGYQLGLYDLPLLAGLLIVGAVTLFFVAVAWGRVWCGFACPQSVWTWIFIRIEQLTEGEARLRKKQDDKGLTAIQWLRRLFKHLLWMLVALATAITFSGYFVPVRDIWNSLLAADFGQDVWTWIIIMAGLTYANAGLVREKICLHACPYSRFQSVMFDSDTRTVSYDVARGEPRSSKREYQHARALAAGNMDNHCHGGDCVDCTLCVQVCPVGIDIRDGLQLACIDCGACIDACDGVMQKLGRASGLIRFASEHELDGLVSPLVRPRLLGYAAVLMIAVVLVGWGFACVNGLQVEVARERGQLYTERADETVCNDFRIKAESFTGAEYPVSIAVVDGAGSGRFELLGPGDIDLHDNDGQWQNYRVCALDIAQQSTRLHWTFRMANEEVQKDVSFITGRR